jgi:hypothetical protein
MTLAFRKKAYPSVTNILFFYLIFGANIILFTLVIFYCNKQQVICYDR